MSRSFGDALKIAAPVLQEAGYCASFGFIGDKHESHHRNRACHADLLPGSSTDDVKYYYTGFHTPKYSYGTPKITEFGLNETDLTHFAEYAIGENSPFKSFLGNRERKLLFDGEHCTGVVLEVNPKDDLDNLFAFSVMCRYTNEKIPGYKLMLKLIANGVHPSEAWYITHFFKQDQLGKISASGYWQLGHTNFSDLKIDLKRLTDGNPHKGLATVKRERNGAYPTCIKRFLTNPDKPQNFPTFDKKVKPSGAIVGRWSSTKGQIDLNAILNSWETVRNELLAA